MPTQDFDGPIDWKRFDSVDVAADGLGAKERIVHSFFRGFDNRKKKGGQRRTTPESLHPPNRER
jgi:hypothetical protein